MVLSSVVGRHIGVGYKEAAIGMVTFGIVGIILVKFGRFARALINKVDTLR